MLKPVFTITDYSALHSTTRTTFADALEVAHSYHYGQGQLTVTISDRHGCRWSYFGVRSDGTAITELRDCPAVKGGYHCECDRILEV